MAGDLAKIAIELEAQSQTFDRQLKQSAKQLKRIETQTRKASKEMNSFGKTARRAAGALAAIGLGGLARDQARYAQQLELTAKQIGITVEQYQELEYAALQAGIQQNDFDASLRRFATRVGEAGRGSVEFRRAFEEMGIALEDANGELRGTYDVLLDFSNGLEDTENATLRNARAVKIVEDEGARWAATLADGANQLLAQSREAQRLGIVLDTETVRALRNTNTQLETVSKFLKNTFANVLSSTIDLVASWTAAWAGFFGDAVRAFQEFAEGRSLPILIEGLDALAGVYESIESSANSMTLATAEANVELERQSRTLQDLSTGGAVPYVTDPALFGRSLSDSILSANELALDSTLSTTSAMADAFAEFAATGKLSMQDFARSVAADLLRVLTLQTLIRGFAGVGSSLGIGFLTPNANGNAFSNGRIQAFAKGGVVSSPTLFGMAGGRTGLMGEAGDEAILPLKRMSSGQLGVQASGQGGGATFAPVINVAVDRPQGGEEEGRAYGRGVGAEIDRSLRGAFQAYLKDQSRPGGMLSPVN